MNIMFEKWGVNHWTFVSNSVRYRVHDVCCAYAWRKTIKIFVQRLVSSIIFFLLSLLLFIICSLYNGMYYYFIWNFFSPVFWLFVGCRIHSYNKNFVLVNWYACLYICFISFVWQNNCVTELMPKSDPKWNWNI